MPCGMCECSELLFGARFGNLTSLQELHRINQGWPLKIKGLLNLKRLVLICPGFWGNNSFHTTCFIHHIDNHVAQAQGFPLFVYIHVFL